MIAYEESCGRREEDIRQILYRANLRTGKGDEGRGGSGTEKAAEG